MVVDHPGILVEADHREVTLDNTLVQLDKVPCYCRILEIKLLVCLPKPFLVQDVGSRIFSDRQSLRQKKTSADPPGRPCRTRVTFDVVTFLQQGKKFALILNAHVQNHDPPLHGLLPITFTAHRRS